MKSYTVELRIGTDINPTTHSWVHITKPDGSFEAWGFWDGFARPEDINKPYLGDDDPDDRDAPTEISEAQYLKLMEFINKSIAKAEDKHPDVPAEISYWEYLEQCSKNNLSPSIASESEYLKFLDFIKSTRPKPRKKLPLPHTVNFIRSRIWTLEAFEVGTTPIDFAPGSSRIQVTRESLRPLSRKQIIKRLKILQDRDAPEPIRMGAMCYSRVPPSPAPLQVEYVCPTCGEKTIYSTTNLNHKFNEREIIVCRDKINDLRRRFVISITLDEASFCSHCSPFTKEYQLSLIVRFEDGSTCTTASISSQDLNIISAFLEGQLAYQSTGVKKYFPLKPVLPRLRELLGIKDELIV